MSGGLIAAASEGGKATVGRGSIRAERRSG